MKKYIICALFLLGIVYSQAAIDADFNYDVSLAYKGKPYNPVLKTYATEYLKSDIAIWCSAKAVQQAKASQSTVSIPSVAQYMQQQGFSKIAAVKLRQMQLEAHEKSRIDLSKITFTWTVYDALNVQVHKKEGSGEAFGKLEFTLKSNHAALTILLSVNYNGTSKQYKEKIEVTKTVIAAFGDSVFSGEGNPDVEREEVKALDFDKESTSDFGCTFTSTSMAWWSKANHLDVINRNVPALPFSGENTQSNQVYWQEPMAHRSYKAIPNRVGGHLGVANKVGEVTKFTIPIVINLARTGSKIESGILEAAKDMSSWKTQGQVDELKEIIDRAAISIDFLIISIGMNEIKWTDKLGDMVHYNDADILKNRVEKASYSEINEGFPYKFNLLDAAIKAKIKPRYVLLTEYPIGPFDRFDKNGKPTIELYDDKLILKDKYVCTCGIFRGVGDLGTITATEVRVSKEIGTALNAKLKEISKAKNWIYTEGVAAAYAGHGYCDPSSFFIRASESCKKQSDFAGTLHPNANGINATATILANIIKGRISFSQAAPTLKF